ncbi:TPA: helix-turn-helix domain-containing protein [Providencia alcalifaciens]
MSKKILGIFIKQKCIEKNISISEIANHLTISEAMYIRVKNGNDSIYVDDLMTIAEMLGVDEREILKMEDV